MIVGNGLIANMFKTINSENYLIFASGVSNSMELNEEEFNREFNLIQSHINTDKKFIYFSTINLYNDDRKYFLHKRKIEDFIINNSNNYLIFRLPNIIGNGGNNNNIFNYFKINIIEGNLIKVQDVYRSLIDIEDIKNICEYCMLLDNSIINISEIESIKVLDIINIISDELNVTPVIEINLTTKTNLEIKNSEIVNEAINYLGLNIKDYTKEIIKKYIKNGKHK